MSNEHLTSALTIFEESRRDLAATLAYFDALKTGEDSIEYTVARDAVVKRFKVTFEYAWKLMKIAAEFQGSEAFGPRPAIQEALRYGWIEDPDFWADALDARNGSVHDYFGIGYDAYLKIVRAFAEKSNALLKKASLLLARKNKKK